MQIRNIARKTFSIAAVATFLINFVLWMKKIKRAFDPANASDPAFSVSPDDYA